MTLRGSACGFAIVPTGKRSSVLRLPQLIATPPISPGGTCSAGPPHQLADAIGRSSTRRLQNPSAAGSAGREYGEFPVFEPDSAGRAFHHLPCPISPGQTLPQTLRVWK